MPMFQTSAKLEELRGQYDAKLQEAQAIIDADGFATKNEAGEATEEMAKHTALMAEVDAIGEKIDLHVAQATAAARTNAIQGGGPTPESQELSKDMVVQLADIHGISEDESKARRDAVIADFGAWAKGGDQGRAIFRANNPSEAKLIKFATAAAARDRLRMNSDFQHMAEDGLMNVVNVMTSDTATSGGEIVPVEVAMEVLLRLQTRSFVRRVAKTLSLGYLATVEVPIITNTGHANANVTAPDEGADGPAAGDLTTADAQLKPQRLTTMPVLLSDTFLSASVDGGESVMEAIVEFMHQEEGNAFANGSGDITGYLSTLANATALGGKSFAANSQAPGVMIGGLGSRYQMTAAAFLNITSIRGLMNLSVSSSDGRNVGALRRNSIGDGSYVSAQGDMVYEEAFVADDLADTNKVVGAAMAMQGYCIHDFPNQMEVARIVDVDTYRKGAVTFIGKHYVAANIVDSSGVKTYKTST